MNVLIVLCCLVIAVNSSMLKIQKRHDGIISADDEFVKVFKYFPINTRKKGCPAEEVHKSCSFFQEYTCWSKEDRLERVKIAPHRLAHCKSGCFCRNGFVREYPGGPCVQASGCRDQMLKLLLDKLPKKLMNIF